MTCMLRAQVIVFNNKKAAPVQIGFSDRIPPHRRCFLFLFAYLEYVEFQVIGRFVTGPENRMIGSLCSVLYLTEAFVNAAGCFTDGPGKKLRSHKVRAGTGGKKAAVLNKFQPSHVDFPISLYRILHRISGFCKCGRIQNDNVEFFPVMFQ